MASRGWFVKSRLVLAMSLVAIVVFGAVNGEVRRATGAEPQTIRVWPGKAPGETVAIGPEKEVVRNDERKTTRITDIADPTLVVYRPAADNDRKAAVIVCPGGGYNYVVVDKEGTEVIEWLNKQGITGILLKYRTPVRKDRPKHAAPLEDAQRAIRLVRSRASEWGVRPDHIGIMGFSAGGHVAALASTRFDENAYAPIDDVDKVSSRPDFTLLIYPAYLTIRDDQGERLAPEVTITARTPPAFLMQTQDDSVRVESSVYYYLGLKNAKVLGELHVYPTGGHGYGMRLEGHEAATWPDRASSWLKAFVK